MKRKQQDDRSWARAAFRALDPRPEDIPKCPEWIVQEFLGLFGLDDKEAAGAQPPSRPKRRTAAGRRPRQTAKKPAGKPLRKTSRSRPDASE
jgi:hypothetical protein